MAHRDDTRRQQQNGQRRGGNRTHHQKGDSQTTGKHVAQSEQDKAERQKQEAGAGEARDESAAGSTDAADAPTGS